MNFITNSIYFGVIYKMMRSLYSKKKHKNNNCENNSNITPIAETNCSCNNTNPPVSLCEELENQAQHYAFKANCAKEQAINLEQQAKELLSEFLIKRVENAQATKINAFFNLLFNVLDNRFNYELNPEVTDKDEIITKKGYTKTEFKRALNCFVSESIPETTDLFKLLPVNNVSEQKNIASMRSRFLMDMSNNDQPFKKLITIIDEYLNDANSENLLEDGCNYLIENPNISPIYKNEAYLKFALAYRYFNFINGGLNEQVNF